MSQKISNSGRSSHPVALITGAGRGFGAALANHLHKHYRLILHAHSSQSELNNLVTQINQDGGEAVAVTADLRDEMAPERLISCARNAFGQLDLLINNAATFPDKDLRASSHDILRETVHDWDEAMVVNARAPFFLMQQAYDLLSANSSAGCIINILDESISRPFLSRAGHSLSKSTLAAATEFAARSFQERIRVYGFELPVLDATSQPAALTLIRQLASGYNPGCTIVSLVNRSISTFK